MASLPVRWHARTPAGWLPASLIVLAAAAWPGVACAQKAVEPVQAQARNQKPAALDTLRELVNIESGSHDKAGLDRLTEYLRGRLETLGAKIEIIDPNPAATRLSDSPKEIGKIIVGRFAGTGSRRLMLMAHMDTVYPNGTLAKRPFRIEGNRAYGPGIADDKGGITVILHTLAMLRTLGWQDYKTLTVVINGDEEVSTPGARDLFVRIGAEQDVIFSCEPNSVGNDGIGLATSGIAAALLKVTGKSAHAGVNPEQGRNALIELSHQLLATRDLSDPARGIKFNWTISRAGTVRNVIPEEASAAADVRMQRVSDFDAVEKTFRERAGKTQLIEGTRVEATFERRRPPLEATDASRAIAKKAQAIYAEIGRSLKVDDTGSGGGTDAAFAAFSGKAAVVESFGLTGYGYHSSEEEFIDIDSIEPRLYLLTRLMMDVGAGK